MDVNKCLTEICEHLFCKDGDYDRCLELIEALAEWIDNDGFKPDENGIADWGDVLAGAWWYCVENYDGMKSDEYRLQCVIGKIYTPGPNMKGTETDSVETMVYDALVELSEE